MNNVILERDRVLRLRRESLSNKMFNKEFKHLDSWQEKEVRIQLKRFL